MVEAKIIFGGNFKMWIGPSAKQCSALLHEPTVHHITVSSVQGHQVSRTLLLTNSWERIIV